MTVYSTDWGDGYYSEPKQPEDKVNHPKHYKRNGMECIDAIEAATSGLSGPEGYSIGNAIKYIWRWKEKGGIEDLRKARWYLDRAIGQNNDVPQEVPSLQKRNEGR